MNLKLTEFSLLLLLLLLLHLNLSFHPTVRANPLLFSVDEFDKDLNRIDGDDDDNRSIEPTTIFDYLWRVDTALPDRIRSLRSVLMRSLMDTNIDPCEDFYQFACGNWEKIFPIPEDKSENNVYGLLNNNIVTALKDLLTEKSNENYLEDDAMEKAKIYYSSCVDQKTRNRRSVQPLLNLLNEFGGWPVLQDNWTDDGFNWIESVGRISILDLNIFFDTAVDADLRDSTNTAIHITEGNLGLDNKEDYIHGGTSLHAYQTLIEEVLMLLNVTEEIAKQTSEEIINLEVKLANAIPKPQLRTNFSEVFTSLTLEELIDFYPKIRWQKFLNTVFDQEIPLNQSLVGSMSSYFDVLPDILSDTDNKIIANYIGWRIAYDFIKYLGDDFQKIQHRLDQALTGKQLAEPHWKKCVKETNEQLGMAVGAIFVRSYFDEESKRDLELLADEIKETFIEALEDMEWLDVVTKQAAEMKANLTAIAVGYPEDILNSEILNKIYENLHVKSETHFENAVNAAKNEKIRNNKRLSQKYDRKFWSMSPAIVNAYFEQTQNRIVVPAAALQPPLYHRHFPKFLNYAGMGYFIGHEFTHGFDDIGREFNFAGNLVEWWSEEAIKAFDERTTCFTIQYSNYSMHGKPLEGLLSRGENIADNGGVRQAYFAYKKWLQKKINTDEMAREHLEGFNLSNTQMFFLQFAQGWCGSIRPEAIDNLLNTDFHCPGKFRVIGTLSNFKEFAEEFNCPVGSPMNPINKCRMW